MRSLTHRLLDTGHFPGTVIDATDLTPGDVFTTNLDGERTHVYISGPREDLTTPDGYTRFRHAVRRLDNDAPATVTFGPGGIVHKKHLRVHTSPPATVPVPLPRRQMVTV